MSEKVTREIEAEVKKAVEQERKKWKAALKQIDQSIEKMKIGLRRVELILDKIWVGGEEGK